MAGGLVIVGGGPGGLSAARGYRQAGGVGSVLILSADDHAPYLRILLSKEYLRGTVGEDDFPIEPTKWYADQRVSLRLGSEVARLDRTAREVELADGARVRFDRLVLATGSQPKPLPVPGADDPGVILVRDRASGEAMKAAVGPGHRVVVIGSGFVGCEVAAALALKGTDVTLITDEDVPHAARLGPEPGRQIGAWLRAAGVDLRLGSGVAAIERVGDDWTIRLVDSSTVTAEVVISASGAQPTAGTRLADHAGLTVDQGGVAVDERLRTDDETVWAVGDLAYAYHPAAGRRLRVEHWADAETMGEIAGADIAAAEAGQRGERTWTVAPGFWTTIGDQVLKYSAWGDGYDQSRLVAGEGDGWAVWYGLDGIVVGVLTHNWDEAYDRGGKLLAEGADYQSAVSS